MIIQHVKHSVFTVFDLITALCTLVFQKYWKKILVKYVPTYTKGSFKKNQQRTY